MTVRASIVIPVKGFSAGKSRLSGVLSDRDREALVRRLAERTVRIAQSLPNVDLVAVTPDPVTADILVAMGIRVVQETAGDLNGALAEAAATLGDRRTIVLPADLPELEPDDIAAHADAAGVGLSPDRRCSGTNMLSLPAPGAIPFRFGPQSLQVHAREAHAARIGIVWIARPGLAFDLDTPADLLRLKGWS